MIIIYTDWQKSSPNITKKWCLSSPTVQSNPSQLSTCLWRPQCCPLTHAIVFTILRFSEMANLVEAGKKKLIRVWKAFWSVIRTKNPQTTILRIQTVQWDAYIQQKVVLKIPPMNKKHTLPLIPAQGVLCACLWLLPPVWPSTGGQLSVFQLAAPAVLWRNVWAKKLSPSRLPVPQQ